MELQKNKAVFDRAGTRIVALTPDPPAKNLRIAQRLGISFSILFDAGGAVIRGLDLWEPRWNVASHGFYLLDEEMGVVRRHRGYWRVTPETIQRILAPPAVGSGGSSWRTSFQGLTAEHD